MQVQALCKAETVRKTTMTARKSTEVECETRIETVRQTTQIVQTRDSQVAVSRVSEKLATTNQALEQQAAEQHAPTVTRKQRSERRPARFAQPMSLADVLDYLNINVTTEPGHAYFAEIMEVDPRVRSSATRLRGAAVTLRQLMETITSEAALTTITRLINAGAPVMHIREERDARRSVRAPTTAAGQGMGFSPWRP